MSGLRAESGGLLVVLWGLMKGAQREHRSSAETLRRRPVGKRGLGNLARGLFFHPGGLNVVPTGLVAV